ncbi:hypothetical protein L210DRAFT_210884 [Boletus edulis BED1]|uniref:Uncharacterized protein n=1 Tax=Boletus edulis BED1 TaxID=1328754 RepID=A0AAD4BLZ7_BOLED|nr:hypothetical protein L210DRAFT_210884 [Boletus edulis BED1]
MSLYNRYIIWFHTTSCWRFGRRIPSPRQDIILVVLCITAANSQHLKIYYYVLVLQLAQTRRPHPVWKFHGVTESPDASDQGTTTPPPSLRPTCFYHSGHTCSSVHTR